MLTHTTLASSAPAVKQFFITDHAAILHPTSRAGDVYICQLINGQWTQERVPVARLVNKVREYEGQVDVYISQQRFKHCTGRTAANVAWLGSVSIDLDYYKQDVYWLAGPEMMTAATLAELDKRNWPRPSYILDSGRGLLVTWLFDRLLPGVAAQRWRAVARSLADAFDGFGVDHAASTDPARVFRLCGTINSRSGTAVEITYPHTFDDSITRVDFEALARAVLPQKRHVVRSLAAERAARRARAPERRAPRRWPRVRAAAGLWETIAEDLQRLRQHRYGDVLPPGQRDIWLFLYANALTWTAPAAAAEAEALAAARQFANWSEQEARSRLSAVLSRARRAERGETVEWRGKKIDPRYRFRVKTLAELLNVSVEEAEAARLKLVRPDYEAVSNEQRRARERERGQRRRRAAGARPQSESLSRLKPWEADGVSRRTWYRRRAAQRS